MCSHGIVARYSGKKMSFGSMMTSLTLSKLGNQFDTLSFYPLIRTGYIFPSKA